MELNIEKLSTATATDVMANPHAYGMPTLEEYKRIRALVMRSERKFESVDQGSSLLSAYVSKQRYAVEGPDGIKYQCKSLEEVERTAKNMGYDYTKLGIYPEVIPDAGLKCVLEITFKPGSQKFSLTTENA